jgi:hypothetical protein
MYNSLCSNVIKVRGLRAKRSQRLARKPPSHRARLRRETVFPVTLIPEAPQMAARSTACCEAFGQPSEIIFHLTSRNRSNRRFDEPYAG